MERLSTNPFYDKYAAKIAAMQRTSPADVLARLETTGRQPDKTDLRQNDFSTQGKAKPTLSSSLYSRTKKLDHVMKIELINDKSPSEIAKIWEDYHRNQDKISAVIPSKAYATILENSKKFSTFLYPLPRDSGYEFFVAQFDGQECHFTSLINYQAYKENAPECLRIFHYPEFQDDKGIVLMHGEYDKDVLNGKQAQCLANQLQMYYTSLPHDRKYDLLDTFTNNPNSFKHVDLIEELTNIPL